MYQHFKLNTRYFKGQVIFLELEALKKSNAQQNSQITKVSFTVLTSQALDQPLCGYFYYCYCSCKAIRGNKFSIEYK